MGQMRSLGSSLWPFQSDGESSSSLRGRESRPVSLCWNYGYVDVVATTCWESVRVGGGCGPTGDGASTMTLWGVGCRDQTLTCLPLSPMT